MNLAAILKMLGVKIPPDKLKQIEEMLPLIPAKANEIISGVNRAVESNDQRLRDVEYGLTIVQLEQRWQHNALDAILTSLRLEVPPNEHAQRSNPGEFIGASRGLDGRSEN